MAKSFLLFIFILFLGAVVTVYTQRRTAPPAKAVHDVISVPEAPAVPNQSDVHSAKGEKKLILRSRPGAGGEKTYEFTVAAIDGSNQFTVFTKTLSAGSAMSLPHNAWDPTDTYIFIEEKDTGVPTYFVINTKDQKVIDVGAVWNEKKIPYTIRQATGWASGTLLIIYTTKDDGSRGPAFWFEVPSTAIIQLAG